MNEERWEVLEEVEGMRGEGRYGRNCMRLKWREGEVR